jgi:hypothetical protein
MRRSNLDRWFGFGRLGLDCGGSGGGVTGLSGGAPWARQPRVSSSQWSGGQEDPYPRVLDDGLGS